MYLFFCKYCVLTNSGQGPWVDQPILTKSSLLWWMGYWFSATIATSTTSSEALFISSTNILQTNLRDNQWDFVLGSSGTAWLAWSCGDKGCGLWRSYVCSSQYPLPTQFYGLCLWLLIIIITYGNWKVFYVFTSIITWPSKCRELGITTWFVEEWM